MTLHTVRRREVTLKGNLEQQELLYVPKEWVGDATEVEYVESGYGTIEIRFCAPRQRPSNKRYRLVEHHGTVQLSLPRRWMRDMGVRPGDAAELRWDGRRLVFELKAVYKRDTTRKS